MRSEPKPLLDPEISVARTNLAEFVHYAMTSGGLAADVGRIAEGNLKLSKGDAEEVLEVLSDITEFQRQTLLEAKGGFSFAAAGAKDKTPYGFLTDDLKKLAKFGEALEASNDTRAVAAYTRNVLDPVKDMLYKITVPPALRKLRAFYKKYGSEFEQVPTLKVSDDNIRRGFEDARALIRYLGGQPEHDKLAEDCKAMIQTPRNTDNVTALLNFDTILGSVSSFIREAHYFKLPDPATHKRMISEAATEYKTISDDVNAYIHELVPSLASKAK